MSMRHLRMGLDTILGYRKQGFFIPYRYADSLPSEPEQKTYKALEKKMSNSSITFSNMLKSLEDYKTEFSNFGQLPPPEPRWEQDWFPRLDAAVAYAMIRQVFPKRVIEVGSGHSTRFMARAIKDGRLETHFTAIDPAPRAAIEALPIEIIPKTLHDAPPEVFQALEAGDILFIDSSHIAMPGTDVDRLFLEIIPALPAGTFIHIHDIFLPDGYPNDWEWRGYNEQQAVAPMVLFGGFELLFASQFVTSRMQTELTNSIVASLPFMDGAFETSLWLKKSEITHI
ncbi:MAG: class I SAM-dependent methyltransferase [Proteobacteria bacterium]|nr:class I SAM-dependent methyltransferase [Pseudomonadota bacterium]